MQHCQKKLKKIAPFIICWGTLFHLVMGTFPPVPECFEPNSPRCIFIDPAQGSNNSSCLTSNNPINVCKNFTWVVEETHRSNRTLYILSNGTHNLASPIATFQNLNYIKFVGVGINETVIQCSAENTGLSFERISNLNFSSFQLIGCSAWRNSTSKTYSSQSHKIRFMEILVAVYIYSCEYFTMDNINVSYSPNATGVVAYNSIGTNMVTDSVFSHNKVASRTEHGGGGGFYVEFTFCIPGDESCSDDAVSYTDQNHDAVFLFNSCLFEENIAYSVDLDNATFLFPYRSNHFAIGRGGGLSIFMKANATRNHISINQCHFKSNFATWGGGLFVEFHDDTSNNSVTVSNAEMRLNHCPFTSMNGTGGGGMRLGHYVLGEGVNSTSVSNRITLANCSFLSNAALNGGGLSISPTVQNVNLDQVAIIVIKDSKFTNNTARLGSAIHISLFAMILDGNTPKIILYDSKFESNTNDYVSYLRSKNQQTILAYQPGLGAVYINQVPIAFRNTTLFTMNNGSALVAAGASLDFRNCFTFFISNQGMNGGAIALLGLAWLRINDNTNMFFEGNVASLDGGAIYNKYIEKENLITYVNCFIRHTRYYTTQPENWTSFFYFGSNLDQSGARPSAIYSTSILPCSWAGGSLVSDKVFCWNNYWKYFPNTNCTTHIHSDIGNVIFTNSRNTTRAFPGRQFSLPLSILDDLHKSPGNQSVFSRSLDGYHNSSSPSVSYIWELKTAVNGNVSSTFNLLLDSISDRTWRIVVEVELEECPPGFMFNKSRQECICLSGEYSGAVFCDPTMQNAYLKNDNWMGKVDWHDGYLVAICPGQYCFSSESTPLPNSTEKLEAELCEKYNRTGILCGECRDGYAVAVNSHYYNCVNCSDENLIRNRILYIAAVYIPLVLLFSLIILLKIRLTSAPANAFILFSQVVASTFDLNADGQISVLNFASENSQTFIRAYKAIYGIFNLEFIEQFLDPLCVGNMTALDVIALDYAVAGFPLVMIIVILILYRLKQCCRCIMCPITSRTKKLITRVQSRGISEAILPAFAAFFLLSYNKFSMTSSFLTNTQPLLIANGNPATPINESLRVYFAGSYSFYDQEYRKLYLIPASFVFATFVAIPPLLLLDFPIKMFEMCLIRVRFLWRRYPVGKVHILLDTFQGCFKNKMRCFAGLYFLFRLAVNTTYNLTDSWGMQYLIQQLLCSIMIGLLLVCQPYNKENKLFNLIDPLIFLNLGILNVISFYLLFAAKLKQIPGIQIFVLQCILVLVPLAYMILYVTWYSLKPRMNSCLKKILEKNKTSYQPLRGIASVTTSVVDSEEMDADKKDLLFSATSEEEALFRRAELKNTYRPPSKTEVRIDEEGEATINATSSTDSGLRSAQSTNSYNNYGSTH